MFARCRAFRAPPPSAQDLAAAFRVLGLSYAPNPSGPLRAALLAAVRRQYRALARLHHPDLSGGDDHRMSVINTAYEVIQASGVLQPRGGETGGGPHSPHSPQRSPFDPPPADPRADTNARGRGAAGARPRRPRVPDDFASGDDAASWALRGGLDWRSVLAGADGVSAQEIANPANHPFSHSKFFTFDEDVRIYRMLRGGATVPQVARTLGKPATFIERRLHNAQFKLRVRWVLRHAGGGAGKARRDPAHAATAPTGAPPVAENVHERLLRRSPYETPSRAFSAAFEEAPRRRQEWEETPPAWRQPRYFEQLSMAEKFEQATRARDTATPADCYSAPPPLRTVASKVGRSYANYHRLNAATHGK